MNTRQQLYQTLNQWIALWQNQTEHNTTILDEHVEMWSFQYGYLQGKNAILNAFEKDRQNATLSIYTANVYIAGQGSQAAISAYIYGQAHSKENTFSFSGTLILYLKQQKQQWLIEKIRLIHGSDSAIRLPHWHHSLYRQDWRPDHATSVIISELDAPWALFPQNEFAPKDAEQQIQDLYSQYAWGLDQADWHLLKQVFSEQSESNLTPMGKRQGIREIYGQLRQFRLAVPYLLHMGKLLSIEWQNDKQANIIVGRIISEQIQDPQGNPFYPAYYQMQVAQQEDGKWHYLKMHYLPRPYLGDKK